MKKIVLFSPIIWVQISGGSGYRIQITQATVLLAEESTKQTDAQPLQQHPAVLLLCVKIAVVLITSLLL